MTPCLRRMSFLGCSSQPFRENKRMRGEGGNARRARRCVWRDLPFCVGVGVVDGDVHGHIHLGRPREVDF